MNRFRGGSVKTPRENNADKYAKAIDLAKTTNLNLTQIAAAVGVSAETAWTWIGARCDKMQWEADRKRHAEFFGGLSPQAEYDKHIEIRRKSDDY